MSNTSVKEAILELVKNEEGNAPLSDKEIVEMLTTAASPSRVARWRNIAPSSYSADNMRRKYERWRR